MGKEKEYTFTKEESKTLLQQAEKQLEDHNGRKISLRLNEDYPTSLLSETEREGNHCRYVAVLLPVARIIAKL